MKPLIYFSYGMTKSGSTLAFELVRTAYEAAGHPQHRLDLPGIGPNRRLNFVSHLGEAQVDGLLEAARAQGWPIVLKTHTRPDDPAVVRLLQQGLAIAHAVVRDPRDAALSMLDHGARARAEGKTAFSEIATLDDAIAGLRSQCDSLTAWLRLPGVMPLAYDDVAFDTTATVRRILAQTGLRADAELIARVAKTQRFTQKNRARRDRYRDEMSPDDSARIATEFRPLIEMLIRGRHDLPADGRVILPPPLQLRTSAQEPEPAQ